MSFCDSLAILTKNSLSAALEAVSEARGQREIASALVAAATLMQDAVLAGQSSESFLDAISAQTDTESSVNLPMVLSRAVNFHYQEDGSVLGFWLLPVVVNVPGNFDATISLATDGLHLLRASAELAQQMGLGDCVDGWVSVLPKLIAAAAMREADLGELIRLPQQARQLIQGQIKHVSFTVNEDTPAEGGLYYLPMVVKHPVGCPISTPTANEKVMFRVHKWVSQSTKAESVTVGEKPSPFSEAIDYGDSYLRKRTYEAMLESVSNTYSVSPKGLVVLLAEYHTSAEAEEKFLGMSFMSKLTGIVLRTDSMTISATGPDYVAEAKAVFSEKGATCVESEHSMPTHACQHCGELQLATPRLVMYSTTASQAIH